MQPLYLGSKGVCFSDLGELCLLADLDLMGACWYSEPMPKHSSRAAVPVASAQSSWYQLCMFQHYAHVFEKLSG